MRAAVASSLLVGSAALNNGLGMTPAMGESGLLGFARGAVNGWCWWEPHTSSAVPTNTVKGWLQRQRRLQRLQRQRRLQRLQRL
jgi:hypothetical protein